VCAILALKILRRISVKAQELHLKLPEDVQELLGQLAKQKKASPEDLVLEALRLYLSMAASELAEELAAWDQLSDEALLAFESKLR
jgi:hypothetical protein